MLTLVNYVEKKYRVRDLSELGVTAGDVITSPKHNLEGIALSNCVLMLHFRHLYSFRTKLQNMQFVPLAILRSKEPVNCQFLDQYFHDNCDNPYALRYIIARLSQGAIVENCTQLPPLYFKKSAKEQQVAIESMAEQANFGDVVFSFDRHSGVSHLIRRIDGGPWSHVGGITDDKQILEATTDGVVRSSFCSLCNPSLDVGLYRLKEVIANPLSEADQERMRQFERSAFGKRFNWNGLMRVYFHRKFGFPMQHGPTPADLIFSDCFHLVAYA